MQKTTGWLLAVILLVASMLPVFAQGDVIEYKADVPYYGSVSRDVNGDSPDTLIHVHSLNLSVWMEIPADGPSPEEYHRKAVQFVLAEDLIEDQNSMPTIMPASLAIVGTTLYTEIVEITTDELVVKDYKDGAGNDSAADITLTLTPDTWYFREGYQAGDPVCVLYDTSNNVLQVLDSNG